MNALSKSEYLSPNVAMAHEEVITSSAEITHQNDNYRRSNGIGNTAIRAYVQKGINSEQTDSFSNLQQHGRQIPYEVLLRDMDILNTELEVLEARHSEAIEALEADRQLALDLTSRNVDEIENAYQEALNTISFEREEEIRRQLATLQEIIGTTWPIPIALSVAERDNYSKAEDEEEHEVIDFIPVEPIPVDNTHTPNLVARARQIDNPNLSRYIELYLENYKNQTVTVEDLYNFCFAVEKISDKFNEDDLRKHVTTALGPKTRRTEKSRNLAEKGLKLQYGWRVEYCTNEKGKRIEKRRTRIYRAVEMEKPSLPEIDSDTKDSNTIDEWEAFEAATTNLKTKEDATIGRASRLNKESEVLDQEELESWQDRLRRDAFRILDQMQSISRGHQEESGGSAIRRKLKLARRRYTIVAHVLSELTNSEYCDEERREETFAIVSSMVDQRIAERTATIRK